MPIDRKVTEFNPDRLARPTSTTLDTILKQKKIQILKMYI